jgi:uroporphyrinogen-III synthase
VSRTGQESRPAGKDAGAGPLLGRALLVTREEEGQGGLAQLLSESGAEVRRIALTRTMEPEDPHALRTAAAKLSEYPWVALTSPRAVFALAEAMGGADGSGAVPVEPKNCRAGSQDGRRGSIDAPLWACVGPSTAAALKTRLGREADLVPATSSAAALGRALAEREAGSPERRRLLFPAAENARGELAEILRAAGWKVDRVCAYRTVPAPVTAADLAPLEGFSRWDAVLLTSGLAVRALFEVLSADLGPLAAAEWMRAQHPAVLGPSAEEALGALDIRPFVRAQAPSLEELCRALIEALAGDAPAADAGEKT